MKNNTPESFSLEMFEGPLSFLLHLIQKSEIQISDIPIQEITKQYLERIQEILNHSVDSGAEFIGTTSLLLWMKSKMLLPKHEQATTEEEDLDPSFEIIHKLLEYCHYKEIAKDLSSREEEQSVYHTRGIHSLPEAQKSLGIEHLTIEDVASLFKEVWERAPSEKGKIHEEQWRVSDKIHSIRNLIRTENSIAFDRIFTKEAVKGELIVTFLAVLELMKIGDIFVGKDTETKEVKLFLGELP